MDHHKGYELCVQNAKNHLAVAKMAKTTCYGIANAHLILGSEEAIKGVIVFLTHGIHFSLPRAYLLSPIQYFKS